MKKISVICHDLSNNCLGRAWVIARLCLNHYEVEVVGPSLSGGIWKPLADESEVRITTLAPSRRRSWSQRIDGDVLVAIKPRQDSLSLAFKAAEGTGRPVIADVDDWEMGFYYDYPARFVKQLLAVASPRNVYRTVSAERKVGRADAVTVSSSWLQSRYGGTVIPHARNHATFDPSRFSKDTARRRIGLSRDDVVIMFVGTSMRHKGVGVIVDAVARTGVSQLILATPSSLPSSANKSIRVLRLPPTTLAGLPELLAAADFAVFPQRNSWSAQAQVPAKIFDALAMALPVITSDVSDLKEVVGEAGIALDPNDMAGLTMSIAHLARSPSLRQEMGATARQRFLHLFSEEVVRPRWLEVVEQAEAAAALRLTGGST